MQLRQHGTLAANVDEPDSQVEALTAAVLQLLCLRSQDQLSFSSKLDGDLISLRCAETAVTMSVQHERPAEPEVRSVTADEQRLAEEIQQEATERLPAPPRFEGTPDVTGRAMDRLQEPSDFEDVHLRTNGLAQRPDPVNDKPSPSQQ